MLYSHRFRQQRPMKTSSLGSGHSRSQSVRSHRGVTGITASGSAEDQIRLVNIRAWGALKMLGKCANPSCAASFRYLGEGMLFDLQPDPGSEIVHSPNSGALLVVPYLLDSYSTAYQHTENSGDSATSGGDSGLLP